MKTEEARRLIALADDEEPVLVPASALSALTINDLPDGGALQVGTTKEGIIHLNREGRLYREKNAIFAQADHTWARKYWYAPLGLEQYLDLVRRAVETRHRLRGDVELTHYDYDGAFIQLHYRISTSETNLGRAFAATRQIAAEIEEAAEQAADAVGHQVADIAARLSGWGAESLDNLVEAVETAKSTDDKGRSESVSKYPVTKAGELVNRAEACRARWPSNFRNPVPIKSRRSNRR